MRKKIVAGNWKMNKTSQEAIDLTTEIIQSTYNKNIQLVLFPPSLYAEKLAQLTQNTEVEVGVQNCSQYSSGAYTGEISSEMIASIAATYALVGHSERREYFNEQNNDLSKKVNQLLTHNISPIYCCGEKLNEREKGNHFNIIKTQIEEGLFHLSSNQILKCVIAYEPVWAIGTGVTASSEQAQEMHEYIRLLLAKKYGNTVSDAISILYGGSCNPANAKELFANKDVDGGLIGGASLVSNDFIAIANSF
jgi:triosephosphate isomerase (TIM)